MSFTERLIGNSAFGWSSRLRLPEHRQIDLYTRRRALHFLDPPSPEEATVERIAAVCRAALALEAWCASLHPTSLPLTAWKRCQELPRGTQLEKILAEIYRVMRVVRKISFHAHGHVDMRDGVVCLNGAIDLCALSLEITAAGLDLLETAVAYYFSSLTSPYPEAYVEAMLVEFFADIVAEIKRFADEDRILCQFRRRGPFNRHFRFDCDNPKINYESEFVQFVIGPLYRDPARTPIDFFAVLDDVFHIIPVEALKDGRIERKDLPRWRARGIENLSLPASFRTRFAREKSRRRPADELSFIKPQRALRSVEPSRERDPGPSQDGLRFEGV
jgi:hypothetical protein